MCAAKYYSQNWGNNLISNPPFLFGCKTILVKSVWEKVNGYDEINSKKIEKI